MDKVAYRHIPWTWLVFTATTALFFLSMVYCSANKFIWHDEIFTYRIAMLPSIADIWTSMSRGAGDTNPPLMHILAHFTLALPLPLHLALRLPAMIGYWIMTVCVYLFAVKRGSGLSAAIAAMLTLCQFNYATEGRIYGVMLGLTGISLLLWRAAIEGTRPYAYAMALGVCLGLVTFSHFYGVVILFAFGLAELVRWGNGARLINPITVSLSAGFAVALILLLPFMRYAHTWVDTFWCPPHLWSSVEVYRGLFGDLLFYSVLGMVFLVPGISQIPVIKKKLMSAPAGFPAYERMLIAGLALIPVWVHALSLYTNAITLRYGIGAVPGVALLCAVLLERAKFIQKALYIILCLLLMIGLGSKIIKEQQHQIQRAELFTGRINSIKLIDAVPSHYAYVSSNMYKCLSYQLSLQLGRDMHPVYCLINNRSIHDLGPLSHVTLVTYDELGYAQFGTAELDTAKEIAAKLGRNYRTIGNHAPDKKVLYVFD